MQEAEGIKAVGLAEAEATRAKLEAEANGIRAKGMAEAAAMEKKAEAYAKYGDVAKLDIITEMAKAVLPSMASEIAKPMGNIDNINIYGSSGAEASGISENVPVVIKKTFDTLSATTGVNVADVLKAETIQAKIEKKVDVNSDDKVIVQA